MLCGGMGAFVYDIYLLNCKLVAMVCECSVSLFFLSQTPPSVPTNDVSARSCRALPCFVMLSCTLQVSCSFKPAFSSYSLCPLQVFECTKYCCMANLWLPKKLQCCVVSDCCFRSTDKCMSVAVSCRTFPCVDRHLRQSLPLQTWLWKALTSPFHMKRRNFLQSTEDPCDLHVTTGHISLFVYIVVNQMYTKLLKLFTFTFLVAASKQCSQARYDIVYRVPFDWQSSISSNGSDFRPHPNNFATIRTTAIIKDQEQERKGVSGSHHETACRNLS